MTSLTQTDRNRELLMLGLRAEGVANRQIGMVFGVTEHTPSQCGAALRRTIHFLAHDSVFGLVEKYGHRGVLIGGIHWK